MSKNRFFMVFAGFTFLSLMILADISALKPVMICCFITQDIAPENPNDFPVIVITNKTTDQKISLKKETAVAPGDYLLKIKMSGYKTLIDGVLYKYQFYVDGHIVIKHHMYLHKGVGRYIYDMRMPKESKKIRIGCGYRYIEKNVAKIGMISRLPNIDLLKLIDYLDYVSRTNRRGTHAFLDILYREIVKSNLRNKLKSAKSEEIQELSDYVNHLMFEQKNGITAQVILKWLKLKMLIAFYSF